MYQFKGWDWSELADCYGIDDGIGFATLEQEEAFRKRIIEYIAYSMGTDEEDRVFGDLRRFIETLANANGNGYYRPVWRALLELEKRDVLLQFVSALLPMMWI